MWPTWCWKLYYFISTHFLMNKPTAIWFHPQTFPTKAILLLEAFWFQIIWFLMIMLATTNPSFLLDLWVIPQRDLLPLYSRLWSEVPHVSKAVPAWLLKLLLFLYSQGYDLPSCYQIMQLSSVPGDHIFQATRFYN